MQNDITTLQREELLYKIKFLREIDNRKQHSMYEEWLVTNMPNLLSIFSNIILIECFPVIYRITVNRHVFGENKRIHYLQELSYPPDPEKQVKRYGRANLKKQSVFYGTFNPLTAMNEVRPVEGDLITISKWECDESVELKYCPIFMNQPVSDFNLMNLRSIEYQDLYRRQLDLLPPNLKAVINELTKFVSNVFAKEIDKDDDTQCYFSAYFTDYMLYKYQGDTIDAICYPSVADNLSINNIAIKPSIFDKYYRLVSAEESILLSTPDIKFPGYNSDGISDSYNIDYITGKIAWRHEIQQPDFKVDFYKAAYKYIPE